MTDNRRPMYDFAIAFMLCLQLLVVCLIGWRMTAGATGNGQQQSDQWQQLEASVVAAEQQRNNSIREQAFEQILGTLVAAQTGEQGLAEKFADVTVENRLLNENLEGQLLRVNQAQAENRQLVLKLADAGARTAVLEKQLTQLQNSLQTAEKAKQALESELKLNAGEDDSVIPVWVWYAAAATGLLICGAGLGAFMTRWISLPDQTIVSPDSETELEELSFGMAAEMPVEDSAPSPALGRSQP